MNDLEILELYRTTPTEDLLNMANRVCRENYGNKVWVRGLIEFSNYCRLDCLYCGIRKSNLKVHRYRLTEDEIVETAVKAYGEGFRTFVLQSGEDEFFTTKILSGIIGRIKNMTAGEAALTLSCGLKSKQDYRELKIAGADRYLMRFETSDPGLHKKLRNGITLESRLKGLYDLKELGFETGSGYMVGLPGETEEIRIQNALLCKELSLEMIGIGPFIPHPDTPLGSTEQKALELTIRATALLRLLLPKANIPATTAAGSIDQRGREKMLEAGANVLMPNITPVEFKKDYLLYPGKICLDETGFQCVGCLDLRVHGIGKELDLGRGNSLGRKDA